jgi:hypothetical protein
MQTIGFALNLFRRDLGTLDGRDGGARLGRTAGWRVRGQPCGADGGKARGGGELPRHDFSGLSL